MKTSGAVSLNTVEVVAYGVQKKVTMTGAISSVRAKTWYVLQSVLSTMCWVVSFLV